MSVVDSVLFVVPVYATRSHSYHEVKQRTSANRKINQKEDASVL
jgi:hypothetical protein